MTNPRLPRLEARLQAAKELAGDFRSFGDIGADHGILSAILLSENPERRAIVADISEAALQKAVHRLTRHGLEKQCLFRVADGLKALQGEKVDVVFILGMGGDTIARILEEGKDALQGAALIVSGHTETELLRKAVYRIGYHLTEEKVVWEQDRSYILLKALPGEEPLPEERSLYLGPLLEQERGPEWLRLMEKQSRFLGSAIRCMEQNERDAGRLALFQTRLAWVGECLSGKDQEKEENL